MDIFIKISTVVDRDAGQQSHSRPSRRTQELRPASSSLQQILLIEESPRVCDENR
jgi:hypothetical protein